MRSTSAQSATSLATAPEEDARARTRNYFIVMGVRVTCFALMVTVTPYSWYTWVFALGAAVLPYLAVVIANVSAAPTARRAEQPRREITSSTPMPVDSDDAGEGIIRIQEKRDGDRT
ncbi:DUF3099 domain-containing protein [Microbacterium marinum]|uniref:DUF3099 domain-containing protein n=1 Tax=Microbacterium marinum TaxID=421115 RepID=UPI00384E4954